MNTGETVPARTRLRYGRFTALSALLLAFGGGGCAVEDEVVAEDEVIPDAIGSDELRPRADVVLTWDVIALDAGRDNPVIGSRAAAMVHLAIHDAVNAVDRRYEQYAYRGSDRRADPVAAAAQAARDVLVALYPDAQPTFDAALVTSLAAVPDGDAENRGVSVGHAAAAAIVALRTGDGSDTFGEFTETPGPGNYQFTQPGFYYFANFGNVKPFGLRRSSQFRPGLFPALTSARYTRDYNEIKAKGAAVGDTRTADESKLGAFWYELSQDGWNRIARERFTARPQDLWVTARTFAVLNATLTDSYIATWEAKIFYHRWRPVTAIQQGDTDGNALTTADPTWTSWLGTPPMADYPSAHASHGGAAAEVLAAVFGSPRFTATSSSSLTPGETRRFNGFDDAADENSYSRIMVGLHFRYATDAGEAMGHDIGTYNTRTMLRRVR